MVDRPISLYSNTRSVSGTTLRRSNFPLPVLLLMVVLSAVVLNCTGLWAFPRVVAVNSVLILAMIIVPLLSRRMSR
jgi:hypothetical protein